MSSPRPWPARCATATLLQLIDVREDYEWDAGRIDGARHIELGEVAAQAETIERDRPVVFYCRVGSRSTMAAQAFRRAGYDAYSMDGGLVAWAARAARSSRPTAASRSTRCAASPRSSHSRQSA